MHSVGSIPHRSEVDVPLNYADYYFIEALKRKKEFTPQPPKGGVRAVKLVNVLRQSPL